MTAAILGWGAARSELRPHTAAEVLVVGGALLAPLNLLMVRNFTVYDGLIGMALLVLLNQRQLRMPPRRYLAASYVFLLASLLSAFRATFTIEALTQTLQYAFIFFVQVPVVVSVVRTRRLALMSILLLCLGSLGAILYAYITQPTQPAGRVLVFYTDNPNRLGNPAVYLFPFLILLWQVSRTWRGSTRILSAMGCLAGALLTTWALFASASRSSVLGSVLALVVLVALRPGQTVRKALVRGLTLVVVVGATALALTSTGTLPNTLEQRVTRSFAADPQDHVGLMADRENLAEAGMQAFVASPFLGTGLDNFRHVSTDYNLDATPQLPHNLWLQLMVQVGVFGTIAFGLLLLFWIRDMAYAFRRADQTDADLIWALASALLGVLAVFLFSPEMIARHYWLIVALGLASTEGALSARERQKGTA